MFLKRFRDKSNQKYINNILKSQKRVVHDRKIQTVGILLNFEEFNNLDQMRLLVKSIGIKDNRVKIISFIEDDKTKPNSWDSFFNPKDFSWKGKIKNTELEGFIQTEFDALICYFQKDCLELNMVTACSEANFKIGLSDHDPRLFDLIIDVEPRHLSVFKNEIQKYLKVLNKI
ncbi:MAG: hypothetical protein KJO41_03750 [Bacteroidia bacterium]|nr:hypothetical protein [Bacteroidia bacterium]MBT8278091.1 hypothetical protein [Bacteroidia bacterium]NND26335.1 hypothetical protein [Flavobacteriaceae bacterium]NNK59603.1 hypothetical protein [Flavobacteriaceae bacterium]NNL33684.1 hypothetical protein [Flavobacteriaceae bacterium]